MTQDLMTIVHDDSNIVSMWSYKLIDDARVIFYNRNVFIIKATGHACSDGIHWNVVHSNVICSYDIFWCLH